MEVYASSSSSSPAQSNAHT